MILTKTITITLFSGKISAQFGFFLKKITRLRRILHDRRSVRSRQISTLLESRPKDALDSLVKAVEVVETVETVQCTVYMFENLSLAKCKARNLKQYRLKI